jgi:hypothetical protein
VPELSVRGISRRFRGITGSYSVKRDLFSSTIGIGSLGSTLSSMSALSLSSSIPDCGTIIDQRYDQIWAHIVVRVKLNPQGVDHLPTPFAQWKSYWKMGIEAIWNRQIPSSFPEGKFHSSGGRAVDFWQQVENDVKLQSGDLNYWSRRWACSRDDEGACRVSFEVQWVESGEHHSVDVGNVAEGGSSAENGWVLLPNGTGLTLTGAAHEYGHMLGLAHDRLPPNGCEVETQAQRNHFSEASNDPKFPWRRTVMCAVAAYGQLPDYLVKPFAENLGSNLELTDN